MRIRQAVVAAADLRSTRTQIEDSLGLPHVWADPGVAYFGLRNALYAIGDTFLEVVSPTSPDAPAQRFIDRRGGDGGYMLIVQTTEPLDTIRDRVADLGIRIVFEARGGGVTGLHLHPADTGGTLLSIDRCDEPGEWPWAGPAWRSAPHRGWGGIVGVTLAVTDPVATSTKWAALLGRPVAADHSIEVDGGTIRFAEADGTDGLVGIELSGTRRGPVTISGVEFTVT